MNTWWCLKFLISCTYLYLLIGLLKEQLYVYSTTGEEVQLFLTMPVSRLLVSPYFWTRTPLWEWGICYCFSPVALRHCYCCSPALRHCYCCSLALRHCYCFSPTLRHCYCCSPALINIETLFLLLTWTETLLLLLTCIKTMLPPSTMFGH